MRLPSLPVRTAVPPAGATETGEAEAGATVQHPPWVIGECWRCDGTGLPVMWVGPVQTQWHGHGPFHACEPCLRQLEAKVCAYNRRRTVLA